MVESIRYLVEAIIVGGIRNCYRISQRIHKKWTGIILHESAKDEISWAVNMEIVWFSEFVLLGFEEIIAESADRGWNH